MFEYVYKKWTHIKTAGRTPQNFAATVAHIHTPPICTIMLVWHKKHSPAQTILPTEVPNHSSSTRTFYPHNEA